jgi:hypothetical protein
VRAVVVTTVLAAALAAPRSRAPTSRASSTASTASRSRSSRPPPTPPATRCSSPRWRCRSRLELGRGLDDDSLRRGGAYAASVGATALTAGLVKITVQRDRPYTYHRHPSVVAYTAAARGNDHSFFSGHTSLSFAALTSGAMLYQPTTTSDARAGRRVGRGRGARRGHRRLRIRAGQHFPTDVMVGAAVGTAFGIGLTYALAPGEPTSTAPTSACSPPASRSARIAAAVVPMPSDVRLPLGMRDVALAPTVAPGHAGLALTATLR